MRKALALLILAVTLALSVGTADALPAYRKVTVCQVSTGKCHTVVYRPYPTSGYSGHSGSLG
jgi:hypothetical protein